MDFRCCCGRRKKRNCGAYSQIDWDALDLQIWYHYHQLLLTIIILFILLLGIIFSVEILTKILNILILFLIYCGPTPSKDELTFLVTSIQPPQQPYPRCNSTCLINQLKLRHLGPRKSNQVCCTAQLTKLERSMSTIIFWN